MSASEARLPPGVTVLERGWLSSNNVVVAGRDSAAVIDSGYWSHSAQTVELVARACAGGPLSDLVNTHLHSDHCGGNSALQEKFPTVRTWIPPGLAHAVRDWDPVTLTYSPTGQTCPRFSFDDVLQPGSTISLGDLAWEIHAAPGHDPHSVVLFERGSRTLVSADALWENGFGIVFPELEGEHAFEDVSATLDVIEGLAPTLVIPGHGRMFQDVSGALARARSRLEAYVADPRRHGAHAAKVLLKFKLLEWQAVDRAEFVDWAANAPYLSMIHQRFATAASLRRWIDDLLEELAKSRALRVDGNLLRNA